MNKITALLKRTKELKEQIKNTKEVLKEADELVVKEPLLEELDQAKNVLSGVRLDIVSTITKPLFITGLIMTIGLIIYQLEKLKKKVNRLEEDQENYQVEESPDEEELEKLKEAVEQLETQVKEVAGKSSKGTALAEDETAAVKEMDIKEEANLAEEVREKKLGSFEERLSPKRPKKEISKWKKLRQKMHQ
jgi:uncharacterized membrane protein (DUF106 family)